MENKQIIRKCESDTTETQHRASDRAVSNLKSPVSDQSLLAIRNYSQNTDKEDKVINNKKSQGDVMNTQNGVTKSTSAPRMHIDGGDVSAFDITVNEQISHDKLNTSDVQMQDVKTDDVNMTGADTESVPNFVAAKLHALKEQARAVKTGEVRMQNKKKWMKQRMTPMDFNENVLGSLLKLDGRHGLHRTSANFNIFHTAPVLLKEKYNESAMFYKQKWFQRISKEKKQSMNPMDCHGTYVLDIQGRVLARRCKKDSRTWRWKNSEKKQAILALMHPKVRTGNCTKIRHRCPSNGCQQKQCEINNTIDKLEQTTLRTPPSIPEETDSEEMDIEYPCIPSSDLSIPTSKSKPSHASRLHISASSENLLPSQMSNHMWGSSTNVPQRSQSLQSVMSVPHNSPKRLTTSPESEIVEGNKKLCSRASSNMSVNSCEVNCSGSNCSCCSLATQDGICPGNNSETDSPKHQQLHQTWSPNELCDQLNKTVTNQ